MAGEGVTAKTQDVVVDLVIVKVDQANSKVCVINKERWVVVKCVRVGKSVKMMFRCAGTR